MVGELKPDTIGYIWNEDVHTCKLEGKIKWEKKAEILNLDVHAASLEYSCAND